MPGFILFVGSSTPLHPLDVLASTIGRLEEHNIGCLVLRESSLAKICEGRIRSSSPNGRRRPSQPRSRGSSSLLAPFERPPNQGVGTQEILTVALGVVVVILAFYILA